MDNTIIAAVIGVIGTFIGTLAGICFGYRLNKKVTNEAITRHEFIKAAADFKITFTEDIFFLQEPIKSESAEFKFSARLGKRLIEQEMAIIRFRAHLPPDKISSFDDAWGRYKYRNNHKKGDKANFYPRNYYMQGTEEEARKDALKYINELMELTKPDTVFG